MWESRRDFQRVWEGWEAGFMAFHAFHTLSFPWPAFRPESWIYRYATPAQCAAPATKRLSLSVVDECIGDYALLDTLWKIEGSYLSFTSWAATPAAQALRGGSTQRAGRSVLRYAR